MLLINAFFHSPVI